MRWLFALLMSVTLARAEGEAPGDFDYYVLSLSWSPNWCALEGDAREAGQCDVGRAAGWILHGLWPQYEQGWPSFCRSAYPPPTRAETAAMADIMGSGGNAWYQWRKHGSCTGLSPQDFYAAARLAYERVTRPPVLRGLSAPVRLPASVIEAAFLQSNPDRSADAVTITCKEDRIQEARLCLTRDLEPRDCAADVVRDCTLRRALFDPVR